MDSSPSQKRPVGLTVGPLAFLLALIFGIVTFAMLNAFDSFQNGEPTPTPVGPVMLDAEYAKLGLAFIAFMFPILFSGMRNSFGPPLAKVNAVTTASSAQLMRPRPGGVSREEFENLRRRVGVLELAAAPRVAAPSPAAVDAAFTPPAPQAPVVATTPATVPTP
jgi:hypothetical protein